MQHFHQITFVLILMMAVIITKFCFMTKTHFFKGIGGHFAIMPPFNPLKIPLTQEYRFFQGVIA